MEKHIYLVADVGGTNTRVALTDGLVLREDSIRRFRNAEHPGIETILKKYLDEIQVAPFAAAIDVAGPVRDGVGQLTNLDWTIDRTVLSRASNTENVSILNDLQAQGHALPHLTETELTTVLEGPAEVSEHAAKLVVNVGTGFNAVAAFMLDGRTLVPPAECGHANLPIRTDEELRLCRFVETAHGFPAIEDVLSGRGLERVYRWLAEEEGTPQEANAATIMSGIGQDGLERRAAMMVAKMLGRVTGNLALVHLPFGGVYLVGGVVRAFGRHLNDLGFGEAMRDKGRFAGFMRNFGVYLVEDDYAALKGLASHLDQSFSN